MTDTVLYQELAETRPRIRRDVLYTQTPTGVLFHNAHGGFSLTTKNAYRFAALLVPHLDGTNRLADLCEGLGESQRTMIAELVATLYKRGFARDAGPAPEGPPVLAEPVAARFGAQLEYLDHYVNGAADRFDRYRRTRVAVLGAGEVARWCALSLVRNGCAELAVQQECGELAAEVADLVGAGCAVTVRQLGEVGGWSDLDGVDLVVVTDGARAALGLLAAGLPDGRRVLPAWTIGDRAVLGPLLATGQPGCWICAALRLGANGEPGAAAELWGGVAPLAALESAGREPGRALAAMLGNLLGYEVFRLTTGVLPAETDGKLIVQHLDTLDTACEPLLPHPRCPHCTALPAAPEAEAAAEPLATPGELDAADLPTAEPVDGPAEEAAAQAALAELETRAVLLRPHAGVFTEYADDEWRQTPLKAGTVTLHPRPGERRLITAFDVHHVAGARLRALHRAAEVYAEQVIPVVAATAAEAELPRVATDALGTASGVRPTGPTRWAPVRSLHTGAALLVPAGALRPFGPHNQDRVFEPTSAGIGAGGTLTEATSRALRSALGYDALRLALRGEVAPAAVPLDLLPADRELTFLIRSAKNLGVELEVLRLDGPGAPLPVVLARTGAGAWTLACAGSLGAAVPAAVRDLLGVVQLERDLGPDEPADTGDPLLRELDPAVLVAGDGDPGVGDAGAGGRCGWARALELLRAAGREVLVAPAGAPDLRAGRIEVVKVLLADGIAGAH
ncbi:TOMM precursor leader peptide-binding protein [Kitasatospora sp. LaBMicrA B282]|uniref:TOMM precursor leader peptide-binding protein n=1 Tax=Kitasatospora sp. LaBMicrA B282 TaxID=3420949 RepID=UPI003D150EE7